MAQSLAAWLKQNEDRWQEAAQRSKDDPGFKRHPDGKYLVKVTKAELGFSQNDRPQIAWAYTILTGDLEGEMLYSYDGLDGEDSLFYVAKNLARYGYEPEDIRLSKLESVLNEILEKKPVVMVQAKTKGDFQNVYVNRVMPEGWDEDEDGDAPAPRKPAAKEPEKPAAKEPEKPATRAPRKPATPPPAPPKEEPAPATEDEDEGDDIKVGDTVSFKRKDKEMVGKITELDDDDEVATIQVGTKSYPVDYGDLIGIVDDENE